MQRHGWLLMPFKKQAQIVVPDLVNEVFLNQRKNFTERALRNAQRTVDWLWERNHNIEYDYDEAVLEEMMMNEERIL